MWSFGHTIHTWMRTGRKEIQKSEYNVQCFSLLIPLSVNGKNISYCFRPSLCETIERFSLSFSPVAFDIDKLREDYEKILSVSGGERCYLRTRDLLSPTETERIEEGNKAWERNGNLFYLVTAGDERTRREETRKSVFFLSLSLRYPICFLLILVCLLPCSSSFRCSFKQREKARKKKKEGLAHGIFPSPVCIKFSLSLSLSSTWRIRNFNGNLNGRNMTRVGVRMGKREGKSGENEEEEPETVLLSSRNTFFQASMGTTHKNQLKGRWRTEVKEKRQDKQEKETGHVDLSVSQSADVEFLSCLSNKRNLIFPFKGTVKNREGKEKDKEKIERTTK